jgi:P27 family predicted phage terminase small subunit
LSRAEPQPAVEAELPGPPDWAGLSDVGKECWHRLATVLHSMKLLTVADYAALAHCCDVYATWRKAKEFVDKHGFTYPLKDEKGNIRCVQQFPEVSIKKNFGGEFARLLTEFGLTPASRTRVAVAGSDEAPVDPMEAFLTGPGANYG